MTVRLQETSVADVRLVELDVIEDDRGFFARLWDESEFHRAGIDVSWVQANIGFSPRPGTTRGLHLQRHPHGEWKLVRCTLGALFDVAVDLRADSPTFGSWFGAELTQANRRMVLVPPGCAHGYRTLVADTELFYMTSHEYVSGSVTGVRFDDPAFGIEWPGEAGPLSDADREWPLWEPNDSRAQRWTNGDR